MLVIQRLPAIVGTLHEFAATRYDFIQLSAWK